MTFGYKGKILRVNLTAKQTTSEEPDELFYRRYFGGRGFIAYFLLRELKPATEPLSGENKLIFACGPVTGAPITGAGRHSVGAKSPLTGGYGESEAGGFWGTELKKAGFDALIIEGKAKSPVYLWIQDQKVQFKQATHLWGKQILEAQETIKHELADNSAKVAMIGPGGEKLVRYASVIHDMKHVAGRCGMGAVMGSKNLKAVAVKGTGTVKVANPEHLRRLALWMKDNVDRLDHNMHTYGTGAIMDVYEETGNLPVNNFRDGLFPAVDSISAQAVKERVSVGMGTCYACVVRCKKQVQITQKPWTVDPIYGGPEYETLAALGSNCGVDNLEAICKANELCQRYSLDTISTGVTISFAMECFENGLLTLEDTQGIKLNFGNAEAMLQTIGLIGEREGIGNLLAEGSKRVAQRLGHKAEEYAVHVKGQEVPMHEPRLKRGLALGYVVSPTGADHMHNIHDTMYEKKIPNKLEGLGILEPVPVEDTGPRKVRLYNYISTWNTLDNCLVMCMFPSWSVSQKVKIVRYVTGWKTTTFELLKVSERATTLARVFNIREGFRREDDKLPPRFLQPKTNGALSNTAVNPEKLKKALDTYYEMMGWSSRGVPTKTKLEELGIEWAAQETGVN